MLLKPLLLWVSVITYEPILTDKEKTAPDCPGNRKRTRLSKIKKKKNFFFSKKKILARTGLTPESRLSQGPGGHQSIKRQQTNIFASFPLHRTQGKLPTLQCSEQEDRP